MYFVGAPYWNETYQDYHSLVGYAQVVYGSLHKTAQVTVITTTRDPSVVLTYSYNGATPTTDNTFSVDRLVVGISMKIHITTALLMFPCSSKLLEAMVHPCNWKKSFSFGKIKISRMSLSSRADRKVCDALHQS